MAAKKHITLDVLVTAGLSLRSKKERRARIAASYPPFHTAPHVCGKEACQSFLSSKALDISSFLGCLGCRKG